MAGGLSDLDELVVRCRKPEPRDYIAEAVACYNAGAFRSAIIAVWIAVVYDFISKLRELEMTGDARARLHLQGFEAARRSADVRSSLQFERTLVERARDDYELISPIEAHDLNRLFEDRNRCAHPSMVSAEEPYQPSAELARTHIKNAVLMLLALPPVQGRAAVAFVLRDVESDYFPSEAEKAVEYFRAGPLFRARDVLVRNVSKVLVKDLLQRGWPPKKRQRLFAAIQGVVILHRQTAESVLREIVPQLAVGVEDDKLYRVCRFLANIPESRDFIGAATNIRIREYIQNAPTDSLSKILPSAVAIPSLRLIALNRLAQVDDETLIAAIALDTAVEYVPEALTRLRRSHSFDSATLRFEAMIMPLATLLTMEQETEILDIYRTNNQVWPARAMAGLLGEFLGLRGEAAFPNRAAWQITFDFVHVNAQWIVGSAELIEVMNSSLAFG